MTRRRLWWIAGLAAALGAALVALLVVGVQRAGVWLVVSDRLEPSDAIFVVDGLTPARELEAAALYHRGLAPRVVLSLARDPWPLARVAAGEPAPQERAARVLQHAGVPPAAIVRLQRLVENSEAELRADFDFARERGFRRIILVTSPVHTRRVRLMWNARYQRALPAAVYPTSYETYDPVRWWRSRRALEDSVHELAGIAHFLIGSPLPTFDRDR